MSTSKGMILRQHGEDRPIVGIELDTTGGTLFISCIFEETDDRVAASDTELAVLKDKQHLGVGFSDGAVGYYDVQVIEEGGMQVLVLEEPVRRDELTSPKCFGAWDMS